MRIGGNSMDTSTYNPSQLSPMIQFLDPQANVNNQPVSYGPALWDVMKKVGDNIQGANYLVGAYARRVP